MASVLVVGILLVLLVSLRARVGRLVDDDGMVRSACIPPELRLSKLESGEGTREARVKELESALREAAGGERVPCLQRAAEQTRPYTLMSLPHSHLTTGQRNQEIVGPPAGCRGDHECSPDGGADALAIALACRCSCNCTGMLH